MLTTTQLSKIRDIINKFKVTNVSNKSELCIVFDCLEQLLEKVTDLAKEIKKLKNDK